MDRSQILAENVINLKYEDLPQEVIEKAKLLILDQLACQLGFATLTWSKGAYRYISKKKTVGTSTVLYYGTKTDVEGAAFCNSVFGHGFEMDDLELSTTSHPGACVVPTVLAMGEDVRCTGKEAITALVAGYETMIRIGRCTKTMHGNFFQGTPIPGGFAAAAVAGQLLGLDADLMRETFAITTSGVSGNCEHMNSGGSHVHAMPGMAITTAIRAAYLAQEGITGPAEAFDGVKSLFVGICTDEPAYEHLTIPFVDNFYILNVGNKPYCCCGGTHGLIDATAKVCERGINVDDIAEVVIILHEREAGDLSGIVHPENVAASQFSARFSAGLRIVKGGNGFHDYTEENVHDPKIYDIIEKMRIEAVPNGTMSNTNGSGGVLIRMNDGTEYKEIVPHALGTVQNPMNLEEISAKFKDLTSLVMPEAKADLIIDTVMKLETLDDLTPLTKLLSAEGGW